MNFVESAFGRLRNRSVSGARGPMQFMPATWAAYGLGGDISDPRDAILGAANYLHANGAPGDEARALYRYNPSSHYVPRSPATRGGSAPTGTPSTPTTRGRPTTAGASSRRADGAVRPARPLYTGATVRL